VTKELSHVRSNQGSIESRLLLCGAGLLEMQSVVNLVFGLVVSIRQLDVCGYRVAPDLYVFVGRVR
jgi:hypothetical protein